MIRLTMTKILSDFPYKDYDKEAINNLKRFYEKELIQELMRAVPDSHVLTTEDIYKDGNFPLSVSVFLLTEDNLREIISVLRRFIHIREIKNLLYKIVFSADIPISNEDKGVDNDECPTISLF